MRHPVAPPAGAWIETNYLLVICHLTKVAPPAGAWIETIVGYKRTDLKSSLPLRERGLKLVKWIDFIKTNSRSPCGSVD